MGRSREAEAARTPSTARTRSSVAAGKDSPVLLEMVASTSLAMAMALAWKDETKAGMRVFMPKISSTPKTIANVVRKVRSLRPAR